MNNTPIIVLIFLFLTTHLHGQIPMSTITIKNSKGEKSVFSGNSSAIVNNKVYVYQYNCGVYGDYLNAKPKPAIFKRIDIQNDNYKIDSCSVDLENSKEKSNLGTIVNLDKDGVVRIYSIIEQNKLLSEISIDNYPNICDFTEELAHKLQELKLQMKYSPSKRP